MTKRKREAVSLDVVSAVVVPFCHPFEVARLKSLSRDLNRRVSWDAWIAEQRDDLAMDDNLKRVLVYASHAAKSSALDEFLFRHSRKFQFDYPSVLIHLYRLKIDPVPAFIGKWIARNTWTSRWGAALAVLGLKDFIGVQTYYSESNMMSACLVEGNVDMADYILNTDEEVRLYPTSFNAYMDLFYSCGDPRPGLEWLRRNKIDAFGINRISTSPRISGIIHDALKGCLHVCVVCDRYFTDFSEGPHINRCTDHHHRS